MLPNFLIIGAQKGATSWLAACLGEHPEIFIPEKKELFFFDKHYSQGLIWYESQFDAGFEAKAVGEATPNYLYFPSNPKRIFNTLGNIKLIASLRHPVDRAYSAFRHYLRRGLISKNAGFQEEFENDGEFGIRSRGRYFEQVSRYLEFFPREDFLIIFQEDILHQPYRTLQQCYGLLAVENEFKPTLLNKHVNQGNRVLLFHNYIYWARRMLDKLPNSVRKSTVARANKLQKYLPEANEHPHLAPDLRDQLFNKYYLQDTEKLALLLKKDLSFWYENLNVSDTGSLVNANHQE